VRQGNFLFRWRSYVPLLLLPAALAALADEAAPGYGWGEEGYHLWAYGCMLISSAGVAIRWTTVAFVPSRTSGRNTRGQRADELNTTGLYSLTRNPLYLGNFITVFGVAASLGVWWSVALYCLAYALYIERVIAAEEGFLARRFGAAYAAWASRTPVFFPAPRTWTPPNLPFSWAMVLRREYNGVLAVGCAFVLLEAIRDLLIRGEPVGQWVQEDGVWTGLLIATSLTFLVFRTLKKHTALLRIVPR
jgi:protein-S-isoprenylcysteine O-methyltransferase Ste14